MGRVEQEGPRLTLVILRKPNLEACIVSLVRCTHSGLPGRRYFVTVPREISVDYSANKYLRLREICIETLEVLRGEGGRQGR